MLTSNSYFRHKIELSLTQRKDHTMKTGLEISILKHFIQFKRNTKLFAPFPSGFNFRIPLQPDVVV